MNLGCKEDYNRDEQPITTLEATETCNLCKLLLHQTTLRTKNISRKQRWIQQNSRQHSKRCIGISFVMQCCHDVASFDFLNPFPWTASVLGYPVLGRRVIHHIKNVIRRSAVCLKVPLAFYLFLVEAKPLRHETPLIVRRQSCNRNVAVSDMRIQKVQPSLQVDQFCHVAKP